MWLSTLSNKDLKNDSCDCHSKFAAFVYEPHGHVHTGKLNIIQNSDLRKVMVKGAKYRLTPSITRAKLLSHLEESLLNLKEKLVSESKDKDPCFDLWFEAINKRVKKRCNFLDKSDLEVGVFWAIVLFD